MASTDEERAVVIDVTANDTPAGMALAAITSSPASGETTISSGKVRYAPAPNFNGTVTFGYRACDSDDRCDESTVAVVVNPVNDPPRAVSDTAATDRGLAVTIDVLANDSDIDGDPLTVQSVGTPAHGSARTDGVQVTYTPAAGFAGSDSFTYRACDPHGSCASAAVAVTVRNTNRPPSAVDDRVTTNPAGRANIEVLANDSDPDGDLNPESVAIATQPNHGEVVVARSGRIRYRADNRFQGTDVFTYRVCDLTGLCDTATVTVIVD